MTREAPGVAEVRTSRFRAVSAVESVPAPVQTPHGVVADVPGPGAGRRADRDGLWTWVCVLGPPRSARTFVRSCCRCRSLVAGRELPYPWRWRGVEVHHERLLARRCTHCRVDTGQRSLGGSEIALISLREGQLRALERRGTRRDRTLVRPPAIPTDTSGPSNSASHWPATSRRPSPR